MKKIINILLLVNIFHFAMAAEKPAEKKNIKDTQFVIEKDRKNSLPETARLFSKIPPRITKGVLPPPHYGFKTMVVPTPTPLYRPIKLARMQPDILSKLYGSYIKAGIGGSKEEKTPYVSIFFDNKRSTHSTYGFHLKPLPLSEMEGILYGKVFTRYLILGGDLQYNYNIYTYHTKSIIGTLTIPKGSQRIIQRGDLHVTLKNRETSTFHYECELYGGGVRKMDWGPKPFQGKHGRGILKTKRYKKQHLLKKGIESSAGIVIDVTASPQEPYTVNLKGDAYIMTSKQQRYLTRVKPTLCMPWNGFRVEGGTLVALHNDKEVDSKAHIFPFVEVQYSVKGDFTPYIRWSGNVQRTSQQLLLLENPMLHPEAVIRHTQQPFILAAGTRGSFLRNHSFHLQTSLTKNKHLYFFSHEGPWFNLSYDNPLVSHSLAEWTYTNPPQNVTCHLRGNYFYYSQMKKLKKPWHRPKYTVDLTTYLNFDDKLLVNATLSWLGGVEEKVDQKAKRLKDTLGLTAGFDYLFTRRIAGFFKIKNPFGLYNQRYYKYTTQPTQYFAGLTYTL